MAGIVTAECALGLVVVFSKKKARKQHLKVKTSRPKHDFCFLEETTTSCGVIVIISADVFFFAR
jgi:hypothetical protein